MWEPALAAWNQDEIARRLDDTIEGWRSWSALHQAYEGPWRDLVHHSGRVLQALTFEPTGAIVAAPTTSLPEAVGGERNWDYRYTWVRDASLTMEALWVAACPDEANKFFAFLADTAAQRWKGKDQGIWEIRGEPRDFLYSKLMCWSALDRAVELAGQLGAADRVGSWTASRDEIRAAILEHGWSDRAGAYTQAFGSDELDASNLMLAITGFLPGDDPRMKATIDVTATRLTDERGLVYRYRAADGLEGEEGTFLLCTFWLAQAQALAGELEAARATFERAAAYAGDLGHRRGRAARPGPGGPGEGGAARGPGG
jgi:GH15 family glucan-1,4-alpha-glucosidase